VAISETTGTERFAIRPYPLELEEKIEIDGRELLLRPIRPEDEPQHREFLSRVAPEDIRLRFFCSKGAFAHSELARFTQIDYDREMAFIATAKSGSGVSETLAVARAITDPDNTSAEFAILVRSDLKGQGLGHVLLDKLIHYCRSRGTQELTGEVLVENERMSLLAASLGFKVHRFPADPGVHRISLTLNPREAHLQSA